MTQAERKFDPKLQSIQHLIEVAEDEWGKPEDNKRLLLPFGIAPLDRALYGMNVIDGEMIVAQGAEKNRKTTFILNVIKNFMTSDQPQLKPVTVIDVLESGATPSRYRDNLLSMVATTILLKNGHRHGQYCPTCGDAICHQIGITPEFLRFNRRSTEQQKVINMAKEIMFKWPLQIYGVGDKEGDTRDLPTSVVGNNKVQSRWKFLIDEYGAKVFISDHLQQYRFIEGLSDYEKQMRCIAAMSDVVAANRIIAVLASQISLTSQREARSGTGEYYAAGGRKAAAEATSVISVDYESGSGKMMITLQTSRKAGAFSMFQPLEDQSGVFYGEAEVVKRRRMQRVEVETNDN